MIRRSGTILTLVLATALLCADRTVMAAAEVQPQAVEAARQVARRLTAGLHSRAAIAPARQHLDTTVVVLTGATFPAPDTTTPGSAIRSPAQLPIPPPAI